MDADDLLEHGPQRLSDRISEIDVDAVANEVSERSDGEISTSDAVRQLRVYLNEAHAALRLVAPVIPPDGRVLEVGSGIGFFAQFLAEEGVDVVELEPVGAGFGFIGLAREALAVHWRSSVEHLPVGVEQLDRESHGTFDLVYSLNVLEHLPDWPGALDRMSAVLRPGGRIVQSCPNYTMPYEPHFGVPLLPIAPGRTEVLLPRRITDTDLWRSLNWVTSARIRRWADDREMTVSFRTGQLADALTRLARDDEFRRRHGGVLASAAVMLDRLHLLPAVRRLPVGLNTPMQFELRHGTGESVVPSDTTRSS